MRTKDIQAGLEAVLVRRGFDKIYADSLRVGDYVRSLEYSRPDVIISVATEANEICYTTCNTQDPREPERGNRVQIGTKVWARRREAGSTHFLDARTREEINNLAIRLSSSSLFLESDTERVAFLLAQAKEREQQLNAGNSHPITEQLSTIDGKLSDILSRLPSSTKEDQP